MRCSRILTTLEACPRLILPLSMLSGSSIYNALPAQTLIQTELVENRLSFLELSSDVRSQMRRFLPGNHAVSHVIFRSSNPQLLWAEILNQKVGCSIHGYWVNCHSAPWARAFTSARSKIQALGCRQLPSSKKTSLQLPSWDLIDSTQDFDWPVHTCDIG